MVTKTRKSSRTSRKRSAQTKAKRSGTKEPKTKSKMTSEKTTSERFVKDLLMRGEAQEPKGGKLPLEATHAVTVKKENGDVKVKRVRFKYY